ncbi:hypothetical protein A2V61_03740 [Candidatus Woesebacteria bacterium RBG_19FT_COMBO_47_8]|uniref:Uncharacterized protein n=1 Tax=Candidatus Woesebacteria bacterium RBG_13_46_13 TaxID=1802479 RepID=A0A1F7X5C8_9BACT|nr:MAG: hypothetical protein A2Y68_02145 [Candidatus Woesebacteria bacterium RBG_13_46_13]OGM16788.1 MAG: hypothetical protein A2V61_03740 [Candidatus Woesebacteria bacterium RBG_19FT_COMBO_47_8]HJX59200.1 hypothetical protein [Patescibacteria group bacterium]
MKKYKTPNLVTLVVLTTITIVFWVFFSVYRAFTQQPTPAPSPEILEPFSPELDKETLGKIQGRRFFEEGEIPQISVAVTTPTATPTLEATASPTPTASAEATLTPSPTSTPSGGLTP